MAPRRVAVDVPARAMPEDAVALGSCSHCLPTPACKLKAERARNAALKGNQDRPHIVLLGDSTVDNERFLNCAIGELSVESQLAKRCLERGWEMTALAQDGSLLQDVVARQVPFIPDDATHIVLSVSGNDLLRLLNQMVAAEFSVRSIYEAIITGMIKVASCYRSLIRALKALGCHVACCTVYRPNFSHFFFKSLAIFSLGMHNSRIQQISMDFDCSVIDLANMFDHAKDFANPLELNTRGGSKVVENVTSFVSEHPVRAMERFHQQLTQTQVLERSDFSPCTSAFGGCCIGPAPRHRVYTFKDVPKALEQPGLDLAGGPSAQPLEFSEEQQRWREI